MVEKGHFPADVFVPVISNLNAEQGPTLHTDILAKAHYRGERKAECVGRANLPPSVEFASKSDVAMNAWRKRRVLAVTSAMNGGTGSGRTRAGGQKRWEGDQSLSSSCRLHVP